MVSRTDTQDMHVGSCDDSHSGTSSHGGVIWTGIGPGLDESWGVSLLTNAYRNVTITIELKRQQSNTLISLGAKATEFPPVGPTSKRVG